MPDCDGPFAAPWGREASHTHASTSAGAGR